MDIKEILKFCLERGFLLDKEVLNIFNETQDAESIKLILEKIQNQTQQKIITKKFFNDNKKQITNLFLALPEEKQKRLENFKIQLGLSIQISKEFSNDSIELKEVSQKEIEESGIVKILTINPKKIQKPEVNNFVSFFRNRLIEMKKILEGHPELNNLVSINKISGIKQNFSIIGIVSEKNTTKNKNILLEIEDLTGKIRVLVNQNNQEIYKKAEDIALDSVIGIRGSGSREMLFANEFAFPEPVIFERKKSPVEEYALFTADLHFGSKKFLERGFLKFIDYLNGKIPNTPEIKKIKYLFIAGDLVTGIGNYPNQERDLKIKDLEEQFSGIAELLGKIRREIKIIICSGNHDAVRLMEPQPILDEKYAWPLYNLKNVILTENPSEVNIGSTQNFSGFNVLLYHGFSFPYYASNIPKLIVKKAMNIPEEIMEYLLKNRHLAPTHGSVQYFPYEKDPHLIKEIPDIFFAGHTHKSAVTYYNNILLISSSSWEGKTPYQEKFGNKPDHCKVPMFNLRTRSMRILDFEEGESKGDEEK